jgi:hypothetical protein
MTDTTRCVTIRPFTYGSSKVITSPTRTSLAAIVRSTARPPTGIVGLIEPE